ncbi:MAG TPA: zinc ribbon domain-containing protein [Solirubrobacterales bacterium]|nr:zinc ribbon domain-containing protein [Solirubrobacterales bacterium]
MTAVVILLLFGLATGIVGRAKGSSFFIWLLVGTVLPVIGLVAAVLYRYEKDDPLRRCPNCGRVHRIEVQVCRHCGEDLFLPDPADVRQPSELRRARAAARETGRG